MNVLITGANRGIGLEFCRQYLADGAYVLAACRQPGTARELQDLAQSPNLKVLKLDVNESEQIRALRAHLSGHRLDLLINNAGVYGPRNPRLPLDRAVWSEVMQTNMMAPLDVVWAARESLQSAGGVAVTITSKMGSIADNSSGGSYIYRSSKAGLNAAMRSLAIDLAGDGVRMLLLHPGWVRTDMGGPNGLIDAETSVSGMRGVIASIDTRENGGFYAYDGQAIPW